jgi:hypothetical protein
MTSLEGWSESTEANYSGILWQVRELSACRRTSVNGGVRGIFAG